MRYIILTAAIFLASCNSDYTEVKMHTGIIVDKFMRSSGDDNGGSTPVIVMRDDSIVRNIPVYVNLGIYTNVWVGKKVTLYLSQEAIDTYSR